MLFIGICSDASKGGIVKNTVSFTDFSCQFLDINPNKILLYAEI